MNLPDIKGIINVGKSLVMANRPEILLGAAIAATGAAVVLAAKGGYDSGKEVARLEDQRLINDEPMPSKAEIVQLTWKNYVPAVLATTTALGATTGLHFIHVHEKRILVASGLAAIEETRKAAQDYIEDLEDSVDEHVTKATKKKIDESVADKQFQRPGGYEVWSDGVIASKYLVRDEISGRDIYSNQLEIEAALVETMAQKNAEGEVSLNTFYNHAGFQENPVGEERGWNSGDTDVRLQWMTTRRDDGTPVAVFRFHNPPSEGFDRAHR
jgi:hypothetical protein